MTHGHLLIRERGVDSHHLYTTHDGHNAQLLDDLAVEQAWKILDRKGNPTEPRSEPRFRGGPWYMQVMLDDQINRSGRRDADQRYASLKDVTDCFRQGGICELYASQLACWLVACWFDRWHVLVGNKGTARGRTPDLVATVHEQWPGPGYTVEPGKHFDQGVFDEMAAAAVAAVDGRQTQFPEPCRVRTMGGRLVVPFRELMVLQAWHFLKDKTPEKPYRGET